MKTLGSVWCFSLSTGRDFQRKKLDSEHKFDTSRLRNTDIFGMFCNETPTSKDQKSRLASLWHHRVSFNSKFFDAHSHRKRFLKASGFGSSGAERCSPLTVSPAACHELILSPRHGPANRLLTTERRFKHQQDHRRDLDVWHPPTHPPLLLSLDVTVACACVCVFFCSCCCRSTNQPLRCKSMENLISQICADLPVCREVSGRSAVLGRTIKHQLIPILSGYEFQCVYRLFNLLACFKKKRCMTVLALLPCFLPDRSFKGESAPRSYAQHWASLHPLNTDITNNRVPPISSNRVA